MLSHSFSTLNLHKPGKSFGVCVCVVCVRARVCVCARVRAYVPARVHVCVRALFPSEISSLENSFKLIKEINNECPSAVQKIHLRINIAILKSQPNEMRDGATSDLRSREICS